MTVTTVTNCSKRRSNISRARVQETERAIARLLGTGGDQGKGSRPRSSRDSGVHGLVASAVGERQHCGSGKRGTTWNRRGLSIWYLIASWPKCTTRAWGTGDDFMLSPCSALSLVRQRIQVHASDYGGWFCW